MKYSICVVGLGYVGLVTAVKLADLNNEVIGIEINDSKLKSLKNGCLTFYEPGLETLFNKVYGNQNLKITNSLSNIKNKIDIIMICVGTPCDKEGRFDLSSVDKVSDQIIQSISKFNDYFLIVMRSTVLPGTTRKLFLEKLSSKTKLKIHKDYDIVMNPEFLREGSALSDFDNPERTIIGSTGGKASQTFENLYKEIKAPLFKTNVETAELSKYIDNSWHALKIAFGNEIGNLANKLNLDVDEVYKIFVADKKLNISSSYLKPGFAFGGSCLPKDVNAINHFNKLNSIDAPILNSIMKSNRASIKRLQNLIISYRENKIGILGLTFKENTNDCRESPIINVIDFLLCNNKKIRIFDEILLNENYKNDIMFKNYNFASTLKECIIENDIIIVTHKKNLYISEILEFGADKIVIDVVGIPKLKKLKNYVNFN